MAELLLGYTDKKTDLLLGLGISSISESATVFHQNEKLLPKYQESVAKNVIPTTRGHILSVRDCEQRAKILQLMTQYQLPLEDLDSEPELRSRLQEFFDFQMLEWKQGTLRVLEAGKPFLRNICSAFDDYLPRNPQPGQKLYSKSI